MHTYMSVTIVFVYNIYANYVFFFMTAKAIIKFNDKLNLYINDIWEATNENSHVP